MLRNVDSHNQRQAEEDSKKGYERISKRPTRRSRWDVRPDHTSRSGSFFPARQTSPPRGEPREEIDYRMSSNQREARVTQTRFFSNPRSSLPPRPTRQWDLGKEMYF